MKSALLRRLSGHRVNFATTSIRRGFAIALCSLVSLAQPAFSGESGTAIDPAKQQLQNVDVSIQKCISAWDKIESNPKSQNVLKDIQLKAQQGKPETFNATASLEAINKIAGKPVNLTAADLKVCVAAYHAQSQIASAPTRLSLKSMSGGYPNCSGACPNPTGPGGVCCGGDTCASACGPEGNDCYAYCESSCFPSDATVHLENGSVKNMSNLEIGDRVEVTQADGTIAYEDVYLMTHQDSTTQRPYRQITLASGQILKLSPKHFIPTVQENRGDWESRILKGANEVKVGDLVWHQNSNGTMSTSLVTEVKKITEIGAFNPMTASGTIVVDGVVASAHSDWFLDGMASADTQGKVYQAILAPVRGIYRVIGPKWMQTITEDWGVVNFVRVRPLASLFILALLFASLFVGARAVWNRRVKFSVARETLPNNLAQPAIHA